MKKLIIAISFLLITIIASAFTQEIRLRNTKVTLAFENIHIKSIEFIDENKIEISHKKSDEVTISQEKKTVNIFSPTEAKIDLKLSRYATYLNSKDGAQIQFDIKSATINAKSGEIIEFREGNLFVRNIDGETKVKIGADGIQVDDENEYVNISSEGIIVESDDETKNITGFWGQTLGGFIKFVTKNSVGWLGNNPEQVAKFFINDKENDNNGIEVNFNWNDGEKITKDFHETFVPQSGSKLRVDNFNGSIELTGWDEDYIDIAATLNTNKSEDEFEKVQIAVEKMNGCFIESKKLEKNPHVNIHYTIKVPQDVKIDKITTSNGKILIIDCSGEMDLKSSNGNIEVFDSDGSFNANTSNARVEFVHLDGKAFAQTSNGRIRVVRTPMLQKAITSNGTINVEFQDLLNNVLLSSSNGRINIRLNSELGVDIDASTSNSRIRINGLEILTKKVTDDFLEGRLNDGGFKISASTSNGSINLNELVKKNGAK